MSTALAPDAVPSDPHPARRRPRLRRPAYEPPPVVAPPRPARPGIGLADDRSRAVAGDGPGPTAGGDETVRSRPLRPDSPVDAGRGPVLGRRPVGDAAGLPALAPPHEVVRPRAAPPLPDDLVPPGRGGPPSRGGPPGRPLRDDGPTRRLGAAGRADEAADLHRLATGLVRRIVEVLAGRRSPAHLAGVARPQVVRYLTVARDTGRATRRATAPRRVHVFRPGPDAAEITAVCDFGPRARALTLRLDRDRTGSRPAWHASAVRLL